MCIHECSIYAGPGGLAAPPVFHITAADRPGEPLIGKSATGATSWQSPVPSARILSRLLRLFGNALVAELLYAGRRPLLTGHFDA